MTRPDYDRGGKFTHYRRLPSLREYVLISQDRPLVEHYVRQGQDEWLLTENSSLEDTLVLPSNHPMTKEWRSMNDGGADPQ